MHILILAFSNWLTNVQKGLPGTRGKTILWKHTHLTLLQKQVQDLGTQNGPDVLNMKTQQ